MALRGKDFGKFSAEEAEASRNHRAAEEPQKDSRSVMAFLLPARGSVGPMLLYTGIYEVCIGMSGKITRRYCGGASCSKSFVATAREKWFLIASDTAQSYLKYENGL